MKTALQFYDNVLRDLRQYRNPKFDYLEFNTTFAEAMLQVLQAEIKQFETVQSSVDNLRPLRRYGFKSGLNPGETDNVTNFPFPTIPANPPDAQDVYNNGRYWRLTGLAVMLQHRTRKAFKADRSRDSAFLKVPQPCRRLTDDFKVNSLVNNQERPSWDNVFYYEYPDSITVVFAGMGHPQPDWKIVEIQLTYLTDFTAPAIRNTATYPSLTLDNEPGTDSPFNKDMDKAFVDRCVSLFLEKTARTNRLQTHVPITQNNT